MPQEQDDNATWSRQLHQDPLGANAGDDDFTKFLDIDGEFSHFDTLGQHNGPTGLDTPMAKLAFQADGGNMLQHNPFGHDMMQNVDMDLDSRPSDQMLMQFQDASQHGRPQYQHYSMYKNQMQQPQHFHVPPTPVSAEMHGAKYGSSMDHSQQYLFERQQATFTPLVSPAQTPLDSAFSMPDYVLADDFFSPLTSPAIEARQDLASTSTTASPVDLNSDHLTSGLTATGSKKPRKKPSAPRSAVRSVRQSPAMKPQGSRRPGSLNTLPADQLESMLQESQRMARPKPNPTHPGTATDESVSPEALSESLMRPPPVPQLKSPAAVARSQSGAKSVPATPATLMRMPVSQTGPSSAEQQAACTPLPEVMEDITLPDSAADLSLHPSTDNGPQIIMTDDQSTPTLSAKTPKLSMESTPRSSGMKASNHPQESASRSNRGGRTGKKRQSVSSSAISPALRPRISPQISPLVPSTGSGVPILSAETSALYLASKSNYQNILDGTHLPGVSYPETLAENLSSKRTSHKIAEQGRRNRINLALKEIESLLPPSIAAASHKDKNGTMDDGGDGSAKTPASAAAASGASKASTVEMAIVYIRSLQDELRITQEKLGAAEKTLAEGTARESGESSAPSSA